MQVAGGYLPRSANQHEYHNKHHTRLQLLYCIPFEPKPSQRSYSPPFNYITQANLEVTPISGIRG